MRQHELIAESMEKKSTYKKIDWQEFFISVIGTAIGIAITFIVDGMLERRNKAQAQRLTAIMVIHDIDNSIDIVKEMREEEERNGELLRLALKQNLAMAAQQLQTPYMKHFLALDARPVLGGIACPVLALAGSKDLQVEPGRNLDALRNGLGANPRNRIECLEGLNHLFQPCVTGAITEYKEIEVTFAPKALQAIVDWLSNLRLYFREM